MPQSTRVAESIYTQESLFDTHAGGTGIVGRSFSGSRSGGKGRIASGKLPEAKTGNTCDKIRDARIQGSRRRRQAPVMATLDMAVLSIAVSGMPRRIGCVFTVMPSNNAAPSPQDA
jgi:hypothetical protein